MKSERRHELQHNQLADAIEHWTVRARPYSRAIAGVLVLVMIVGVGMAYVSGKNQAKSEAAWDEYFDALNSADRAQLTEIAAKYAGTPVAPWARIVAADLELGDGCMQLFNQKAEGRELVQQAVDNYQTVLREADSDELKQRALFGLGRGHEALGALADITKARKDYQQLIDGYPEGLYTPIAKSRLADLERGTTKQFYDWFAKYEPPRAGAGVGKKMPFDEESLNKDMKLPSVVDQFDDSKKSKSKDDSILDSDLNLFPPDTKPDETKPDETTPDVLDSKPFPGRDAPPTESPADAPTEAPAEPPAVAPVETPK